MAHEHQCHHSSVVSSVHQTLDEMDFERGLWSAALNGETTRIDKLMMQGADVNKEDSSGYSPLVCSATHRSMLICKVC